MNGSLEYSKVVFVNNKRNESVLLLYPNPVGGEATLLVSVSAKEQLRYSIYDQSGRLLSSEVIHVNNGSNLINIPVNVLIIGIYTIQVQGAKTQKHLQFVKK